MLLTPRQIVNIADTINAHLMSEHVAEPRYFVLDLNRFLVTVDYSEPKEVLTIFFEPKMNRDLAFDPVEMTATIYELINATDLFEDVDPYQETITMGYIYDELDIPTVQNPLASLFIEKGLKHLENQYPYFVRYHISNRLS